MCARILVAFDGSTQANFALRYALTTYAGEGIHVLHVDDPRERTDDDESASDERAREASEEVLGRAEGIAESYDSPITTETRAGEPATSIVTYAEDHDVDHVVLGTHGRRGLSRYLLGSVAEDVIRRAHVPVTTVRDDPPKATDRTRS